MTQPTHDNHLIDRGDYISGKVHTGIPPITHEQTGPCVDCGAQTTAALEADGTVLAVTAASTDGQPTYPHHLASRIDTPDGFVARCALSPTDHMVYRIEGPSQPTRHRIQATTEQAVAALDAIPRSGNPEVIHSDADEILLSVVPPEVAAAYDRLVARTGGWWFG